MPIDMSLATKAPPRKTAARPNQVNQQSGKVDTRSTAQRRTEGLLGLAQLGQGVALMFGQYADAAAIGQFFPPVAQELANVAEHQEIIAKPIDVMIEVGPYGALIAAGMPFILQIAANHKWLNASMLAGQGVVPPEVLDAKMRAQVARMQADAMKEQRQAMADSQAAQRDLEAMLRQPTAHFETVS